MLLSAVSGSSTNEIRALTGLRGLAALYVVTYHRRIGVPFSNPLTSFLAHGYLAVDLFFVLSGFVMAMSYGSMFQAGFTRASYLKFLGRRLARIYPLYLMATIVGFLLVITGSLKASLTSPVGVALLLNVIMVQAWGFSGSFDGPGWSISAEWAAYLVFPALLVPTIFGSKILRWISAIAAAAIVALLCALPASLAQHSDSEKLLDYFNPYFALPVLRCLPEFVLGMLAFRIVGTRMGVRIGSSSWIAPIICMAILVLLTLPRTDVAVVLLFPLLVISMAAGSHMPARLLGSKPAHLAGMLSYSIYLTNELIPGLLNWIPASGLTYGREFEDVAGITLALPIAYLAHRFIEMPGRKWLRAILERRSAESIGAVIPVTIPT